MCYVFIIFFIVYSLKKQYLVLLFKVTLQKGSCLIGNAWNIGSDKKITDFSHPKHKGVLFSVGQSVFCFVLHCFVLLTFYHFFAIQEQKYSIKFIFQVAEEEFFTIMAIPANKCRFNSLLTNLLKTYHFYRLKVFHHKTLYPFVLSNFSESVSFCKNVSK